MSKQFIIAIVVSILALFGIYTLTSNKDNGNSNNKSSNSSLTSHVTGQNAKKVTLVEYGDYQCPACGQYHPLVKQVVDKYNKDIQFQFRNFPLTSIHPNARAAARAAEAAGLQNKYWEMHDLLYEQQNTWESSNSVITIFEGYARQLGLDVTRFKADFASEKVNKVINADFAEGTKLGIQGTPTFFIQGKKIENPQTIEGFNKLIDQAIAQSK